MSRTVMQKLLDETQRTEGFLNAAVTVTGGGQTTLVAAPGAGKRIDVYAFFYAVDNTSAATRQINLRMGAAGTRFFLIVVRASNNFSTAGPVDDDPVALPENTALIFETGASFTGTAHCTVIYRVETL